MTTTVTVSNKGPSAVVVSRQDVTQGVPDPVASWTPLFTLNAGEAQDVRVWSPQGQAIGISEVF